MTTNIIRRMKRFLALATVGSTAMMMGTVNGCSEAAESLVGDIAQSAISQGAGNSGNVFTQTEGEHAYAYAQSGNEVSESGNPDWLSWFQDAK